MYFRNMIVMLAAVMILGACTSTKDKGEQIDIGEREGISAESLYGSEVKEEVLSGPEAGTQQDLVVNVGDRVFFGYDRYDLTEEARSTLELQAEWLKRYPLVTVTIAGHTDERGTREYNLALGERRANSVKSYLVALGISPDRISTVSFGKEQPAVLGSNPTSWARNRRAVTEVD